MSSVHTCERSKNFLRKSDSTVQAPERSKNPPTQGENTPSRRLDGLKNSRRE